MSAKIQSKIRKLNAAQRQGVMDRAADVIAKATSLGHANVRTGAQPAKSMLL